MTEMEVITRLNLCLCYLPSSPPYVFLVDETNEDTYIRDFKGGSLPRSKGLKIQISHLLWA